MNKQDSLTKKVAKVLLGLEVIIVGAISADMEYDTYRLKQVEHSFYARHESSKLGRDTGGLGEINRVSRFSELIWENTPNVNLIYHGKRIEANSASMRDDQDHSKIKGPKTFRIISLGDSFTYVPGVGLGDTYQRVLERCLNQPGNNMYYDVLNFGVLGFNAKQECAMYKYVAREYDPDLVILAGFSHDEIIPCGLRVPKGWELGQPIDPSFFDVFSDAPAESIFLEGATGTYLFGIPQWYKDNFTGTDVDIKEAYDELRSLTERDNVPVVLTMVYRKLRPKLPNDEIHLTDTMLEMGKRMGFHISDPHQLFKDYIKRNGLEGMIDFQISEEDFHFREEANAILALSLYNTLVNHKLIPDAGNLEARGLHDLPFFEDVSLDAYVPQKPFSRLDFQFDASLFNRIRNLHMEPGARVYKSREPITGRIELRNVSSDERTMPLSRKIRRKGYSSIGDKTLLIRLYKVGLGGEKELYCNWDGGLDEKLKYVNVGIAPGASNAFNFSIPQRVVDGLEYGNYRMEIAYFGADPLSYRPFTTNLHFTVRSCRWQGPEHEMEMRKLHDELKKRRNDISRGRTLERGKQALDRKTNNYRIIRGRINYGGF